MPSALRIQFGPFELDLETGELWKRKKKVGLSPGPFRVLKILIQSAGQLVTRESLQQQLWGNETFVDFEHGLNFCIREIRIALGDNARKPKYIETLPRRGYRFIGKIASEAAASSELQRIESYERYTSGRKFLTQAGKEALEKACAEFQEALRLDPEFALAHSGLGAAYALRHINRRDPADLESAKAELERALELDQELTEPYSWLCFVYNRQGKIDLAVETGRRAVKLQPEFVQAHYFLGLALFLRCESGADDYQAAAQSLITAGRINAYWQASWFVLAALASLVGDYRWARIFAEKLLALNQQPAGLPFIGAENVLAAVELRQGRPQAAVRLLEDFLARMETSDHMYRDGMSAAAACGLGEAFLLQGQTAQALAAFRRAWHLVQEHPRMMAHQRISARALAGLASAYFAEGDSERARGLLQRAVGLANESAAPVHAGAGASMAELFVTLAETSLRAGDRAQALDFACRAVAFGWRDAAWLAADPALQALRDEPRFQELIARLRCHAPVVFE